MLQQPALMHVGEKKGTGLLTRSAAHISHGDVEALTVKPIMWSTTTAL